MIFRDEPRRLFSRRKFMATLCAAAVVVALPPMATAGFMAGKAFTPTPPPPPPPVNAITAAGGSGAIPSASAVVHGSGWGQPVIAEWDEADDMWVTSSEHSITLGAAIGDPAYGGISRVDFYLNGNVVTVTEQTINPRTGSIGWCITPQTGTGPETDNNYTLYAKVVPVNGYEVVLALPLVLNTNGTISRGTKYVDGATGNDTTGTGTSLNPWKTIGKALTSCSNGDQVEVAVNGTSGTIVDANGASNRTNTRQIRVYPKSGKTIVVTRASRATTSGAWTIRSERTLFEGLTFDMAYYNTLNMNTLSSCSAAFLNCSMVDSNGVTGPTSGYSYQSTDQNQTTCTNIQNQRWAFLECTITSYVFSGWTLLRNVTMSYAADACAILPWQDGIGVFKSTVTRTGQFYTRDHVETFLTVASSSYDGTYTTINWVGTNTFTTISSACLCVVYGQDMTANGIAVHDQTGQVTRLVGNQTATFGPGVMAWIGLEFHSDTMQFIATTIPNTSTGAQNIYFQRYKSIGQAAPSQGILSQPGPSATVVGAGTVSTVGTALTCTLPHSLQVNYWVHLTNGSQSGQYSRVTAVPSSTTATLEHAFTVDQAAPGATWTIGRGCRNIALIGCIFHHVSAIVSSQWSNGNQNWLIAQCTHIGMKAVFATTGSGFGVEGFAIYDTIWNILSGAGFPTVGITIDNNQYQVAPNQGTNGVVAACTFNATYQPTSGVSKTLGHTPIMPFDYDGNAITSTSLIGAQQAP